MDHNNRRELDSDRAPPKPCALACSARVMKIQLSNCCRYLHPHDGPPFHDPRMQPRSLPGAKYCFPRPLGPHCHKAAGVRVPLVGGPIGPVLLSLIVIEKGSDLQTPTSLPRARSPYSPAPTGGWLRRAFFLLICFFCHLSKMHLTRETPMVFNKFKNRKKWKRTFCAAMLTC